LDADFFVPGEVGSGSAPSLSESESESSDSRRAATLVVSVSAVSSFDFTGDFGNGGSNPPVLPPE
jgi:hypothetical protein